MKESYKIKIVVLDNDRDELTGKIFDVPIIPRMNDYLEYKFKKEGHDNVYESGAVEVRRVTIHTDRNIDATVNVKVGEDA
ncbi:hypothetical protein [Tetragenococcus halophilus]|uniref:Uncharacterized protein n=1 Tax=Tetragenococcus halophilus (strain DSM 20338 / JCM 20259 / NCIMB 9735 / NBRC 12172) TaxID=945021 RepID=A0AAN1SG72_TETHN|nr:hypothetical protein [Tetragenococcus halophilus]MDN6268720.1 hypothetical protein [Tetragenococcus koreensis]BAK94182.1 hypothetical protein TEH_08550 [Tetragenococcus halophilus NBRC 12172]GBD70769.1 putative uncharacterized protein [Tetragenococcus halophilus subsp. halophilus]